MTNSASVIDPALAAKARRLTLRAKRVVEGFLVGLHRSPFHGFSVEFSEHRPYTPGDDVRWVDWKLYSRRERAYVKKFEEETNLRAWLLLDTSGSMGYGEPSKLEYGKTLLASLAYLLVGQRDGVGLLAFDTDRRLYLPPRNSEQHLARLLLSLVRLEPSGMTAPQKPFGELAQMAKRRGLVVIVSDLEMEPEAAVKAVRAFGFRKHETLLFHLLSKQETDLPVQTAATFVDMETGEKTAFNPAILGKRYRERLAEWREGLALDIRKGGAGYQYIRTDTPLDRALLAFLKKRERMR